MDEITVAERYVLSLLPQRLYDVVKKAMALYKGVVSEIRIRADCPVFLTANGKNVSCGIKATYDEISKIVRVLCGNSMYSHSETIREGYICVKGGVRAGICGRAITEEGRIMTVTDISSVCIRIPHRVIGAADNIINTFLRDKKGILIYSEPGVGKTTVLREFSVTLSSAPYNMRVAVVDTRFEICGALGNGNCIDALCGYPRAKGIETALRVLSPELIVCDEIGNIDDAEAIVLSAGAGIPVVASVHAGTNKELLKKTFMSELLNNNIFGYIVKLSVENGIRQLNLFNAEEIALC